MSELMGDPVLPSTLPLATLCTVVFLLFAMAGWWRLFGPAPVQTSARLGCTLPTEHETLLIFINARPDGSIDAECGPMVGGRGAYPGARK